MSAERPTPQGPGALLEAARRRHGLHIVSLAAQLKVSPARLEALEAERWEALPGPTHSRALATSVCRVLGIDPGPVLAGMPRGDGAALDRVTAGLNEPVRATGALGGGGLRWGLALGLPMLLVAAGIAFWPADLRLFERAQPSAVEQAEPAVLGDAPTSAEPAPTADSVPQATAETPPALAASTGSPEAAPQAAVAAPPTPQALPQLASPVQVQAATPASVAPGPALPTGTGLQIRAERGASWVSVSDLAGNTLVARLLEQGETLSLPAERAPLELVLGNAPALELSWRGQAQALIGYEQRRVARLQLK